MRPSLYLHFIYTFKLFKTFLLIFLLNILVFELTWCFADKGLVDEDLECVLAKRFCRILKLLCHLVAACRMVAKSDVVNSVSKPVEGC